MMASADFAIWRSTTRRCHAKEWRRDTPASCLSKTRDLRNRAMPSMSSHQPAPTDHGFSGVGAKLKSVRLRRGFTQEELASHSGIAASQISRIENGRHRPHPRSVARLARALAIPLNQVLPPENFAIPLGRANIAPRIRKLRLSRSLSTRELAAGLKVGRSAVWNWETGKTRPGKKSIQSLACYFGVPFNYVAFGRDNCLTGRQLIDG